MGVPIIWLAARPLQMEPRRELRTRYVPEADGPNQLDPSQPDRGGSSRAECRRTARPGSTSRDRPAPFGM